MPETASELKETFENQQIECKSNIVQQEVIRY